MAMTMRGRQTVLALDGTFDAAAANKLLRALVEIEPDRSVIVDFHEVRVVEVFALALLASEVGEDLRGRVTLFGLSGHHQRLLGYFGFEPGGARLAAQPERTRAAPVVLLVDDDDDLRAVLAEFLSREGYDVREAAGVRGAFREATDHHPAVVVLDPAMANGSQILERLREGPSRKAVPVVALSEPSCSLAEGWTVLQKPFDLGALAAALERVLPGTSRPPRRGHPVEAPSQRRSDHVIP